MIRQNICPSRLVDRLVRPLFGPLLGAWLAAGLVGCAHRPATLAPGGGVSLVEMEPLALEVSRSSDGAQIEAYDAPTLFTDAGQQMDADDYAAAAKSYDRLISSFPDSPYLPPALFNAGLSYEGLGRYADAADRYRRIADDFPSAKVSKDAALRRGACLAELEKWPATIELFEKLLGRSDLSLGERLEAMARRGLGLVEIGDLAVAEGSLRDTVAYYQAHKEEERIESPFFVAMAQFYHANLAHRRFRALPLRPQPSQLEPDLQAMARQFLVAQQLYVDAIRLKDPLWASAAAYHVGTLYRELYDSMVKAPLPSSLTNDLQRLVYSEQLKGNLRNLLDKARSVLEKNLEMAGRVGVKNGWIDKSSEQLTEISKLLAALDDQELGPSAPVPKLDPPTAPPLPQRSPRRPQRL